MSQSITQPKNLNVTGLTMLGQHSITNLEYYFILEYYQNIIIVNFYNIFHLKL